MLLNTPLNHLLRVIFKQLFKAKLLSSLPPITVDNFVE